MASVIPLNAVFLGILAKARERTLKSTDSRVKLTNEVLQGIRSIKSYAWETPFLKQVEAVRAQELSTIMSAAKLRGVLVAFLGATPSIVSMVTLWAYVALGNTLSASKVFTALALFNQLRFPLLYYPMVIAAFAEGRVALTRLQNFLDAPQVEGQRLAEPFPASMTKSLLTHEKVATTLAGAHSGAERGQGEGVGIHLHDASFSYAVQANRPAPGAQTAWVPNEAFRDCVLFGSPYDAVKYQRTLDACCLGPDVARLEASDQTEIGERGVTLSGGQKQRLALARAVYADADIYLLDDPFSALDAQVGRQVFENCLRDPKGPLAGKAVVLVTNQLQFLPYVDKIVVMGPMEGGNGDVGIIDQGRYWDLIARGHDLESMLASSATAAAAASPSPSHDETERQGEHGHHADIGVAAAAAGGASGVVDEQHASYHQLHASDEEGMEGEPLLAMEEQGVGEEVREEGQERGKLMKEEERITGAVKAKVYKAYLGAVRSPLLILLAVISFVVANGTQFIQQAIIAAWTSDPLHIKRPARVYLLGVSSMAAMVAAFNYLRTYLSVLAGVRASDYLHHRALQKVLGAPMRYFDTTPLGSLVQRFSSDLDQVDQQLPGTLGMFITCVFQLVGTLGAILAATPQFSVALFPISWIYLSVMNYFRAVTRELKRLDSLSRSPIYSHFSETLVDDNVRAYISLKAADRWLSVRLELLGAGVVGIGAVLSVHGTAMGHLGAGLAGLALTNALGVTGLLNWAVRCLAETEAIMNSVERVQQLVESVPAEAPAHLNALSHAHDLSALDALHRNISSGGTTGAGMVTRPVRDLQDDASLVASGWPWKGGIYFRRAVMRYREDTSPILQGFTAAIRPKEKIGIVGRTGAGKSSLFVGLLRLVELEGGSIEIDGVDISKVGLATLRSAVSVIPQDPVLFSGSIRSNLDPFQTYDDATLWSALRKASLEAAFRTSPLGLDQPVSEYGENLSSGQRQLLCLARALLRKPRILLLDEATSSVDQATDQLIQETIRREFLDCTVLTIAHRTDVWSSSTGLRPFLDGETPSSRHSCVGQSWRVGPREDKGEACQRLSPRCHCQKQYPRRRQHESRLDFVIGGIKCTVAGKSAGWTIKQGLQVGRLWQDHRRCILAWEYAYAVKQWMRWVH
ncbi:multidrug resistance-associated protein 1 [Nannochloropsis gaditana]|uniref:Multidrug resistance-associated protein 1 n=2 Tax=Nannochloropsis gaditana TaxID=72520 RepID=W7TMR9_9STRA|nr:multidrug resistance-associated protein 1 [Nannochloropsis gaditana]